MSMSLAVLWIDFGIMLMLGVVGLALVFRHFSMQREADMFMLIAIVGLTALAAHDQIGALTNIPTLATSAVASETTASEALPIAPVASPTTSHETYTGLSAIRSGP